MLSDASPVARCTTEPTPLPPHSASLLGASRAFGFGAAVTALGGMNAVTLAGMFLKRFITNTCARRSVARV